MNFLRDLYSSWTSTSIEDTFKQHVHIARVCFVQDGLLPLFSLAFTSGIIEVSHLDAAKKILVEEMKSLTFDSQEVYF